MYGGVRGRENLFNFPSYSITRKRQTAASSKRQRKGEQDNDRLFDEALFTFNNECANMVSEN